MATEKVGIYRKYYGPIPKDKYRRPLNKAEWPKKRPHSWAVRWFDVDGKRYSKSFKTRKEADRFAEDRQQKVRDGQAKPHGKISISDFRKEHNHLMKGNLAKSSLREHLRSLDLLSRQFKADRRMDRITMRDIERFRANLLSGGRSSSTANKYVRTLQGIFNLAILRGYLPKGSNPCTGIPVLKVGVKQNQYIKPSEFQQIYAKAQDSLWRAFLTTIYTTGLRLEEATNLTWHDIDFECDLVCVTRRNATGLIQAWTPKDHELRTIPLPKQTVDLLTAWQSVAPENCPYVFMNHGRWEYYCQQVKEKQWKSGQALVNNSLRRFQTLCRRAGVGPYTLHDMRRSCITNWAKHLPVHVVAQLAGHSDIRTTQRYYLSVQPEDIRRAQKVQSAVVGKIPEDDLTDPKVTHSRQKRVFPGRRGWSEVS